jgi:hypothetical protein
MKFSNSLRWPQNRERTGTKDRTEHRRLVDNDGDCLQNIFVEVDQVLEFGLEVIIRIIVDESSITTELSEYALCASKSGVKVR